MKTADYLFATILGLLAAGALLTKAAQAPASYIGDFTSPWFAQIGLFLAVLLPYPMLRLHHNLPSLSELWLMFLIFALLAGATGLYMAVRFVIEQPTKTATDWIILVGATAVYLLANGALLYRALKSRKSVKVVE